MSDFKEFLEGFANKADNLSENNENDFYDENNILICGICREAKEVFIPSLQRKVKCVCKCAQERMDNLNREREHLEFISQNICCIDPDYRNVRFEDVENLEIDYSFAKKFVDKFDEFKKLKTGLYIYGDVGCGKTYISSAIANELLEREYKVYMSKFNDSIFSSNMSSENMEYYKNQLLCSDLIILDDFGASRETEYQLEQVYNFINFLYSNKKVVIFTSNIPRSELGNASSITKKRIYDRIIEMTYGKLIESSGKRKEIARDKMKRIDELLN